MNRFTENFLVLLKGAGMGAADVVPGVSGGTIALMTGIYSKIIDSINSLSKPSSWKIFFKGRFREFWKKVNGSFLFSLLLGILISVFCLAHLMGYVRTYYPVQTWAFFCGLIVASSVLMISNTKEWTLKDVLYTLLGTVAGVTICLMTPGQTPDDIWFIFICGAIAICMMILPGISGSFVLLLLGKYDFIMQAVRDVNVPILVVFACGCIVGIILFARALRWLLDRWERHTMLVMLGFVIGSLVKIWPWNDMLTVAKAQFMRSGFLDEAASAAAEITMASGADVVDLQIPGAILWALIGIALVVSLEYLGRQLAK